MSSTTKRTRGTAAGTSRSRTAQSPAHGRDNRWALRLGALVLATLLAYRPAWNGGLVWDDDAHLTAAPLQSVDGLARIWFEPGATQQYYPLVHSAFWLFNKLWGHHTLGYHLANIILHALSAFLIALILRRLAVPGALLAAVIFALHPVHVESVAWMSELKNTLSGFLYLSAALVYLRFRTRATTDLGPGLESKTHGMRVLYAAALLLFIGALLSKTVTATLPAALLVVFWWKHGRLRWRHDVVPLLPFFVLGAAAGLFTAWVEQHFIGAQGHGFQFSILERGIIAGRAFWFYLHKLFLPVNLMFIYPRWDIRDDDAALFFYPLAAIVLAIAAWMIRRRTRAPLAALLLFAGTLTPALGFFNVYPFRYSFVADHFLYLASIPVFTFVAALVVNVGTLGTRRVEAVGIAAIGIPLGMLTWMQSLNYVNAETLYRVTLDKNPSCWMCQNNLALPLLEGSGEQLNEAVRLIESSLRTNPEHVEALNNLGVAYRRMGRLEDAMAAHRRAVELSPKSATAHNNLGTDLHALSRFEEARRHYETAIALDPSSAEAHRNLGATLTELGRLDEAARPIQRSLELFPQSADAHHSLGTVMLKAGRSDDAIRHFNEALRLDPQHAGARNNLGMALELSGKLEGAAAEYREAARIKPGAITYDNLGYVLLRLGRHDEARTYFEGAIQLQANYAPAHINLGHLSYASKQFPEAISHYREAVKHATGNTAAEAHNALGVVLATTGSVESAIMHFREALRLRPDYAEARANLDRARADRRR